MAEKLKESDWENLLQRIKEKNCTPFIGAGACSGVLPLGKDIAHEWADKYDYPLSDKEDLARVAQFLAVEQDNNFPKENIKRKFSLIPPPDFNKPDEPHGLLADLNLPVYITTNYDSFMYLALKHRERDPKRELCHWNPLVDLKTPSVFGNESEKTDYEPTPANPLVYHLHGHYDTPQSMVLTEDDYLNFLVNFSSHSSEQEFLPATIRAAMASTSLLFIGYSLSDWNFRVLFRGLLGTQAASSGYQSVAVQLAPNLSGKNKKNEQARAQAYLDSYFETIQQIKVRVYWGDIREFTIELRRRWEEFAK